MPTDLQICRVQDLLLDIPIGTTRVVHGHAVTRWAKDSFEGRDTDCGSEHAAEQIANR